MRNGNFLSGKSATILQLSPMDFILSIKRNGAGLSHSESGPAIITRFSKIWCMNGELHREDGPAFVSELDRKEYWTHGNRLTEEEFLSSYGSKLGKILYG